MKPRRRKVNTAIEDDVASPPPEPVDPAVSSEGSSEAVSAPGDQLRREIAELRQTLAAKIAELRSLEGPRQGGESVTLRRVVGQLRRPDGATKAQLVEETGAKPGYIDALLSRILAEKGYTVVSEALPTGKAKLYRIPSTEAQEIR
jgi:hypothetical protein